MLKILYENKNILVCVKPAGVLSQSSDGGAPDETDMLKTVSAHIGAPAWLLNRLDRGTGGIMAFSKRSFVTGKLSEALSDKNRCIKEYLAVVSGIPEENDGELRDYLYKDGRAGKSYVISSPRRGAKEAMLTYRVLGRAEGEKGALSLVRVRLGTGRTHQIRVQFSSRGMPIVGDGKYGSRERVRGEIADVLNVSTKDIFALHAARLCLDAGSIAGFNAVSLPDISLYPFSLFHAEIAEFGEENR